MPKFIYKAKNIKGEDQTGTVETSDERQVAKVLNKKGLIVINIKEVRDSNKSFLDKYLNRVSFNELVIVTRQLATMIESGLVLSEALDILKDQQTNVYFKDVLSQVSRDVKGGMEFATALKKHPNVYPALYINLIKAGEESGKLDVVLSQTAANLEKTREFRNRVRGAMIYPIIVLLTMSGVMAVMMFFVVPKMTSLYSQSSMDLPLPTKILITTSNMFTQYWWAMILLLIFLVMSFKKYYAKPEGKFYTDSILIKTPVIGRVIEGTVLAEFTRTFGLLITAGIPILDALSIVTDIVDNGVYKKALKDSCHGIERGLTLSSELEHIGVFPKIIPAMFRVGEETGKMDQVSFKMAEYFESEADHLVKNLTVILEPVILVVLGIGVAFLVLSIIMPIYKLTTSFSG